MTQKLEQIAALRLIDLNFDGFNDYTSGLRDHPGTWLLLVSPRGGAHFDPCTPNIEDMMPVLIFRNDEELTDQERVRKSQQRRTLTNYYMENASLRTWTSHFNYAYVKFDDIDEILDYCVHACLEADNGESQRDGSISLKG